MKRRVVSVLIAGILFFSNIGVTSFAAGSGLSEASGAAGEASTEGSTMTEQDQINNDVYGEEEISYFKITDFTELPEDISNQKIRVGGKLEDLELPDTLEVTVEPDYEHDERIERGLAQERERIRREELEADEGSSSSSDEGDAASSSDSEDGEKIIFFDEDGTISEEAGDLSSDEDGLNEDDDDEISTLYDEVVPEPENVEDSSDSNTDNGGNDEEISSPIESGSEEHSDGNSEEATDEATEGGLISWLTHTFRNVAVAYAADIKDSKTTDEEASVELISDVEWILEPEYNYGVEEFSADEEGEIYLFTPVLLIPDTYYVEDELPIITVTVTDDYYAFDKETVVDDVKIRVRADKGVFPEDARVTAKKLAEEDEQKVKEVVDEQVETENVVKEYTFDITVKDKEGNEVQPDTEKGRVVVSFEAAEVEDENLEAEVYHIIDESKDDREPEEVVPVALGGEREKERVVTIFDENSVLKAEKLEAEVVEIEDAKVLVAETDSFSPYKVIFKTEGKADLGITDNPTCIDDYLANIGVTGKTINSVTLVEQNDSDYLFIDRLADPTDENNIIDGVYKKDVTEKWYLIVRQPFDGEKDIKVTFTDNVERVISVSIDTLTDYTFDCEYPYGLKLGEKTFTLGIDVNKLASGLILYQWQYYDNEKGKWVCIDRANTAVYGSTMTDNGVRYRCIVNGRPSKEVQIVTANGDKATRKWTNSYGSKDQCYVTNGLIAYTISSGKEYFDVVGQFTIDGKNTMLPTTPSCTGWSMYNTDTTSPSGPSAPKKIRFSFSDTAPRVLFADVTLNPLKENFAFGGNVKFGNVDAETMIVETYKTTNTSYKYIDVIRSEDLDTAQAAVNAGTGDEIPSLVVISDTSDASYYAKKSGSKLHPFTNKTDDLLEGIIPEATLSWEAVDTDDVIEFTLSFAGVSTNGILKPVSKMATSNSYSSGNIKSVKLSGSELDAYAKRLGEPSETILIEMKNGAASTSDKTAITNILPTYNKANTTSTASSTSIGSTSTSQSTATKYTADYYGVTFTYKKGGKTTIDEDGFYKDKAELPVVLTEEISYDFKQKEDIRLFRCHDGDARELSSNNPGTDGTFRLDKDAGKIYIYASNFSSFAVAYKPEREYTVTFNDGTNKWDVKVKEGEKVAAPESMPTKDGVTAQFWYKGTLTSTTKPTAYDFNTPVTANMTLNAYYGKTFTVTFSGISPSTTVKVAEGDKVARPADPVKEGYTFKGWYSDKTAKTLYNFDSPVTKDLTLYAGFVDANGRDADDEDGEGGGSSRAPGTRDTLPPVWLWVLVLIGGVVVFSCNLYARAKEGKVKFSQNKNIRKITRVFLLIGLVIVTVVKFLIKKVNEKKREVALGISGAVILIAAGVLIFTSIEYHKSEQAYGDASKTYVQETQKIEESSVMTEEVKSDNNIWWNEASVEMETLTEEYPNVIGWIYFENEDISYPIMYSGDNTKYLNTSYDGEKARAGAIFLDGESTPDFSDPHSLIYGHNMRDMTMFGKLRFYKTDASYYDEHQYFQIFTKDGVYRYQIFAYEEVPDSHDVFWVYGKDPEGMWDMLQDIEGGSYRQTGIEATESDHVITLATCTSKEDRRLIVSALRTDEHDYEYVASN